MEGDNPTTTGNAGPYLTQTAAVDRLANLLAAESAKPTTPEDKAQDKEDGEAQAPEPSEEVETPAEADEEEDGTEKPEEDEAEDEESSIELTDEFEIELEDGSRTTLADLKNAKKQVKEFQRDYTVKTTALKADREVVESKAQQILAQAQQLQQDREDFLAIVHEFVGPPPQRPQASPSEDPMAWMQYNAEREIYQERLGRVQSVQEQRQQQLRQTMEQQQAEMPKVIEAERSKLVERFPKLKNPEVAKKTQEEILDVFTRVYGFEPGEVGSVVDSRFVHVMLDAIEFNRIKSAQPAVKEKVEKKPPLIKAGKRQSPQQRAANDRREMHDRLRKSGSKMDAVAILKALDL